MGRGKQLKYPAQGAVVGKCLPAEKLTDHLIPPQHRHMAHMLDPGQGTHSQHDHHICHAVAGIISPFYGDVPFKQAMQPKFSDETFHMDKPGLTSKIFARKFYFDPFHFLSASIIDGYGGNYNIISAN
jgi:hypothetical protein